jgi:hypothetical protein
MTTFASPLRRISFDDFAIAFVPFGLLLSASLVAAEATLDLGLYRTVFTIWAATILVAPALCIFTLPGNSRRQDVLWLLFWTFSFVVYVVHLGYAVFSVYHGSLRELLHGQGLFAAINNGIFTLWWMFDLLLAWFFDRPERWIRLQRIAAHWYIGLTFFLSTVFLKHGFVNVLGCLMTGSVLICLMIRFDARLARTGRALRDGLQVSGATDFPGRDIR